MEGSVARRRAGARAAAPPPIAESEVEGGEQREHERAEGGEQRERDRDEDGEQREEHDREGGGGREQPGDMMVNEQRRLSVMVNMSAVMSMMMVKKMMMMVNTQAWPVGTSPIKVCRAPGGWQHQGFGGGQQPAWASPRA